MSGSLPPDVILRARLGPYPSLRRQRASLGSTVRVYVDATDPITGEPVTPLTGASALYWLPEDLEATSPGQPVDAVEITPGTLAIDVPGDLPGTYAVWCGIGGPSVETVEIRFDVPADGNPSGITLVEWSSVQAAGAAAGASAARAEVRVVAVPLAEQVGAEAGAQAGTTAGAEAGEQAGIAAVEPLRDAAVAAAEAAEISRQTAEAAAATVDTAVSVATTFDPPYSGATPRVLRERAADTGPNVRDWGGSCLTLRAAACASWASGQQ